MIEKVVVSRIDAPRISINSKGPNTVLKLRDILGREGYQKFLHRAVVNNPGNINKISSEKTSSETNLPA